MPSSTRSTAPSAGWPPAARQVAGFCPPRRVSSPREGPCPPQVRADINELITQLEARNPTSSPAEEPERLSGSWRLAYTSNSELIALLALGRLPGVVIGDVVQNIDAATSSVENRVEITGEGRREPPSPRPRPGARQPHLPPQCPLAGPP